MFWRIGLAVVASAIVGGGLFAVCAQEATPVAGAAQAGAPTTLVLVERATHRTTVDNGDPGSSVGDLLVWGPNPLYDESNTTDSGATTHGACISFNAAHDCLFYGTILFPDGSTIETQGIQPGAAVPSTRDIVGGSGRYRGATGTIEIEPSADFSTWKRTFTIWP